ncbi:hypothetical protein CAEBREN_25300 [Caenorhabditis brenneri]|uniref:Uncharacterized protein n=1 Tax=Caenorhabditis brenneri TaxID=135651 RepID=G0PEW1_CAEBE|nr:hypothetical protein CAEBREN_25300 [Caenorhabditis brenneri]
MSVTVEVVDEESQVVLVSSNNPETPGDNVDEVKVHEAPKSEIKTKIGKQIAHTPTEEKKARRFDDVVVEKGRFSFLEFFPNVL